MTKEQLDDIRDRVAVGTLRFGSQFWQAVDDREVLLEEVDRLIKVVGAIYIESLQALNPGIQINPGDGMRKEWGQPLMNGRDGTNHASTDTGGSRQEEPSP